MHAICGPIITSLCIKSSFQLHATQIFPVKVIRAGFVSGLGEKKEEKWVVYIAWRGTRLGYSVIHPLARKRIRKTAAGGG